MLPTGCAQMVWITRVWISAYAGVGTAVMRWVFFASK
jgi:hypothetical protein